MSFVDDRRIVEVNDMVVRVEAIINIIKNAISSFKKLHKSNS